MGEILVTGGAGFVGSWLSKGLLEKGKRVVVVDNLSNGSMNNLPEGAIFCRGDVSNDSVYEELSRYNIDVVIHCAAQASNAISFKDPALDLKANQIGTLKLLEFCGKKKVKRFIFTSSMSVYGETGDLPTSESTPCMPDSYYGVHKLASEHYIRIYCTTNNLDYTIFRLYTTYGEKQNLENRDQGLVSIYLSYILSDETLVVKGSGDRDRDIVHVSDVVRAIVNSVDNEKTYGKTYNVASGKTIKVRELVEKLLSAAGKDVVSYPVEYVQKTPGDPHSTHGDVTLIHRDMDWNADVSIADGIGRALGNHSTGV